MNGINVGVLIYTFNRVDDAKINMEIIRHSWECHPLFVKVPIVHAYNGEKDWWPDKYLEDELVIIKNTGHFSGAAALMDAGIKVFQEKFKEVSHVIILAADTWLMKPEYLADIIQSMNDEGKYVATCGWIEAVQKTQFWRNMALDFFIVNLTWASTYSLFPIRYKEYIDAYSEIFDLLSIIVYLEQLFLLRFRQAVIRSIGIPPSENLIDEILLNYIFLIKDREPITVYHPVYERKMYSSELGLIGHHDPIPKQAILKKYIVNSGRETKKFLESKDLNYFNNGFITTNFVKQGKED